MVSWSANEANQATERTGGKLADTAGCKNGRPTWHSAQQCWEPWCPSCSRAENWAQVIAHSMRRTISAFPGIRGPRVICCPV